MSCIPFVHIKLYGIYNLLTIFAGNLRDVYINTWLSHIISLSIFINSINNIYIPEVMSDDRACNASVITLFVSPSVLSIVIISSCAPTWMYCFPILSV